MTAAGTGTGKVLEVLRSPARRLRAGYRELTAPMRGLPSVLIIGAQKGGTTSLFNYLVQHPGIREPFGKEIHYFDLHYGRGPRWYQGRFPYRRQLEGGKLTLDASPYYLAHPLAAERAAAMLPTVKLIALLRNPIDRALSHYQHERKGGREPLSFAEAIAQEPERTRGEEERLRREPAYYSWNHHRYTYLRRGQYVDQLRRWAECFPRERLLVLQSEALFRDPAGVTEAVYRFLDLAPHRLGHYKTFLAGSYERGMPAELRTKLAAHFEPYNRELYRWLGEEYDWA